jgi:hypothetical protein
LWTINLSVTSRLMAKGFRALSAEPRLRFTIEKTVSICARWPYSFFGNRL